MATRTESATIQPAWLTPYTTPLPPALVLPRPDTGAPHGPLTTAGDGVRCDDALSSLPTAASDAKPGA